MEYFHKVDYYQNTYTIPSLSKYVRIHEMKRNDMKTQYRIKRADVRLQPSKGTMYAPPLSLQRVPIDIFVQQISRLGLA